MSETIIAAVITAVGAIVGGAIAAYGRAKTPSPARPSVRIYAVIGGVIGGVLGIVSGILLGPSIGEVITKLKTPAIPLEIAFRHDFENVRDVTDPEPWEVLPEGKGHNPLILEEEEHSGRSSLRLEINIQKYSGDRDKNDFAGVGVNSYDYPNLKADKIVVCVAWLLLPDSDSGYSRNRDMNAHFIAYTYDDNRNDMGMFGEDTQLMPGEWTPVFWFGTYTTQFEFKQLTFDSADTRIHELYLNVFDFERSYEGFVYIDDIVCYTEKR